CVGNRTWSRVRTGPRRPASSGHSPRQLHPLAPRIDAGSQEPAGCTLVQVNRSAVVPSIEANHRRLAVILAADVASYSRLMSDDEEATLKPLADYREVIAGLTAEHSGRIFGTAGDSIMIEFASPVQAVRCAVAIQRATSRRNADLPDTRRMVFRIGINVGD